MKPVTQIVQKVTSLELSKALKAAGGRQKSEFSWWDDGKGKVGLEPTLNNLKPELACFYFAGLDCPELLEELPSYVSDGVKEYWLTLEKLSDEYHAMYCDYHHGPCGTAAVEVLGRLLLWGLENGHVEKEKA